MNDTFGIVIYEKAQPMDIMGPWETLAIWKNILKEPISMYLISENGSYVECDNDIVLKAHYDFEHCPQLDILIVPGGHGRRTQVNNERLISFIKKQATHCKYILSDCTGMFLLEKTGLLDGKSVTTYWRALPELTSHPNVHVVGERIVKNGNIWTAAGITSGIDMTLELIKELAGKEKAGKVQLLLEYFPWDRTYSTKDMISSLPPYNENDHPYLPEYIKKYIAEKGA
jgi:transcriptional regulator GlxA family with amidase domain